jgi:hypothetical protein
MQSTVARLKETLSEQDAKPVTKLFDAKRHESGHIAESYFSTLLVGKEIPSVELDLIHGEGEAKQVNVQKYIKENGKPFVIVVMPGPSPVQEDKDKLPKSWGATAGAPGCTKMSLGFIEYWLEFAESKGCDVYFLTNQSVETQRRTAAELVKMWRAKTGKTEGGPERIHFFNDKELRYAEALNLPTSILDGHRYIERHVEIGNKEGRIQSVMSEFSDLEKCALAVLSKLPSVEKVVAKAVEADKDLADRVVAKTIS